MPTRSPRHARARSFHGESPSLNPAREWLRCEKSTNLGPRHSQQNGSGVRQSDVRALVLQLPLILARHAVQSTTGKSNDDILLAAVLLCRYADRAHTPIIRDSEIEELSGQFRGCVSPLPPGSHEGENGVVLAFAKDCGWGAPRISSSSLCVVVPFAPFTPTRFMKLAIEIFNRTQARGALWLCWRKAAHRGAGCG